MLDIKIKRVESADDIESLFCLTRTSFAQYIGVQPPMYGNRETFESITQLIEQGEEGYLAIGNAGDQLGFVLLDLKRAPQTVYIHRIGVAPDSQSRGVGSALMDLAERRGIDLGLSDAMLTCRAALAKNIEWYEKRGYSVVEHGSHEGYSEITWVRMHKDLMQPR